MNVSNEYGDVIEVVNGFSVKQHFNRKVKRWYVWLPKHSGLRELFSGRDRVLRSHYVWCRSNDTYVVPFGFVIHHADHDRTNDSLTNLLLMSESDHDAYHSTPEGRAGFRRGWDTGSKHKPETIERFKEVASSRGNNDVWGGGKKEHFDSTKKVMSEKASGGKNAMYRHDIDTEAVRRCYETVGDLANVAKIFGCSVQAVRNRIKGKTSADWKAFTDEQILNVLSENEGSIHKTSLAINAPTTSLWRRVRKIQEDKNAA